MKLLVFVSFLAFASARSTQHLLGDEECTMGPSYWCKNYQTAKQCGSMKYCTERVWAKKMKATTCDTCKEVVGVVHAYLADNITETEVIQALNGMCSFLGSYASECKALVNTYGKEIMSLVSQYTANPAMICQMLGMCKAEGTVNVETAIKMQKIMPIVFEAKKQFAQPRQSALCTVCEFAMSEIDSYISKASSEKTITEYVEKICNYLPSTIKTECDALITEYGKEIIALLVKELSPKTICTELKVCTASVSKLVQIKKETVKSGVTCELCETLVGYVETMLNNNTEAEIVTLLEQVCSELGSYKAECDSIVKTYVPSMIELLKKELTPQLVCKELGLCTALNKFVKKVALGGVKNGTYCAYCKLAVTYIDNLLKDQKTEAEITTFLESLCSYLGAYKAECKQLMTAYLPLVFKYLAQELSPDLVCKELGLCTAMKPLALNVAKMDKVKKVEGAECEVCEYVVTYVEGLVNTKTEAEIVAMVDKYCAYLGSYKAECDSLVKTYLPKMIEMLKKEFTPALVCKELGLCTTMKELLGKIQKSALKSGTYCSICKMVVTFVDSELQNKKTQTEITSAVEELCSLLGTYQTMCKSYVSSYLPLIFKYLALEMTPDAVCKELGLCTSSHVFKPVPMKKAKKVQSGTSCEICEVAVGYIEGLINTKTEAEITTLMEEFCAYLGSYKSECDSLVKTYLPTIIELLKKELSPKLVCTELGLCTAMKKLISHIKLSEVRGGTYCTICKVLVGYVDSMLKSKKTEAEITSFMESICSYLGSYQTECKSYMSAYLPLIFKYLAQEMTPDLVCKELSLCTSSSMKNNMPNYQQVLRV